MWAVISLAVLAAVIVLMAGTMPFDPVCRRRMEKFAYRQRLHVTPDNAEVVVQYLATTRRWRGSGLFVSIVLACAWSLTTGHGLDINSTAAFIGWFVGAVVAEWRVSVTRETSTRAAVLEPRSWRHYLDRSSGLFVAFCLVAFSAGCLAATIHAMLDGREKVVEIAGWFALAVAIVVVLVVAARRAIGRPQPVASPELLDADDAIRSRTVHVLAGVAIAATSYLAAGLVSTVVHANYADVSQPEWYLPTSFLCGLVVPFVGFLVATRPFHARADRRSVRV